MNNRFYRLLKKFVPLCILAAAFCFPFFSEEKLPQKAEADSQQTAELPQKVEADSQQTAELPQKAEADSQQTAELPQKAEADSQQLKEFSDKDKLLIFSQIDKEILQENYLNNSSVYSIENHLTRNFYDDRHRVIKKEFWTIEDLKNSKIEKTESFEYFPDSLKTSQKTITKDNTTEIISYDENGLSVKAEKSKKINEKSYPVQKTSWIYNDKNELVKQNVQDFLYDEKRAQKLTGTLSRTYEYNYNNEAARKLSGNDFNPDFKYFENNVLKIHNVYKQEKGTWISYVYLDDDFSVVTYYKNHFKTREVYIQNKKVVRDISYDEN